MWDELKRTDVELAKQKLAELRKVTLQRHAEELKQLDVDEAEIDNLVRLAEAITQKYLNGRTRATEEPTPAIQRTAAPTVEQEEAPPGIMEVSQNVSPNFGGPLRRLVRS
jgi:hypothetical protein